MTVAAGGLGDFGGHGGLGLEGSQLGHDGGVGGELDADLGGCGSEYRIRFAGTLEPLDALDSGLPPAPAPSPAPASLAPGSQYSITGLLQSLGAGVAGDCTLGTLSGSLGTTLGTLGTLGALVQSEQPAAQHHLAFSKLGEHRQHAYASCFVSLTLVSAHHSPHGQSHRGQAKARELAR